MSQGIKKELTRLVLYTSYTQDRWKVGRYEERYASKTDVHRDNAASFHIACVYLMHI
jgi:hypothetical protein